MSPSREDLEQILSENLNAEVSIDDMTALTGGSINEAARLRSSHGDYFVKWNASKEAFDQFETEHFGLELMADTETPLTIPRPVAVRESHGDTPALLITEFVESAPKADDFDEQLGKGLAALHQCSRSNFGFDVENYLGATTQPNTWYEDWIPFFRDQRLKFQLDLADERRGISSSFRKKYETLLEKLPELLVEPDRGSSLIHGDLWSGNVINNSSGGPAIIDPAPYFGHRETEFGMMVLFGNFNQRVYETYHEVYPLKDGWRERAYLYKLYHVMNHYNLFGGHYLRQAKDIVERFV